MRAIRDGEEVEIDGEEAVRYLMDTLNMHEVDVREFLRTSRGQGDILYVTPGSLDTTPSTSTGGQSPL